MLWIGREDGDRRKPDFLIGMFQMAHESRGVHAGGRTDVPDQREGVEHHSLARAVEATRQPRPELTSRCVHLRQRPDRQGKELRLLVCGASHDGITKPLARPHLRHANCA